MAEISPGTIADVPQLTTLLGILFEQEADFTPDPARQETALRLILATPSAGRIYCARHEGRVQGMVNLLLTISTAEGGPVAWIEDMIVHPDVRGQGVGEQLLAHAICEARLLGCTRITLLTDSTNAAAHRFYQRVGFLPSSMAAFRLKL